MSWCISMNNRCGNVNGHRFPDAPEREGEEGRVREKGERKEGEERERGGGIGEREVDLIAPKNV